MDEDELLKLNEDAIMAEYDKWVATTGYLVPPATDAWLAGWQAALNKEMEYEGVDIHRSA